MSKSSETWGNVQFFFCVGRDSIFQGSRRLQNNFVRAFPPSSRDSLSDMGAGHALDVDNTWGTWCMGDFVFSPPWVHPLFLRVDSPFG